MFDPVDASLIFKSTQTEDPRLGNYLKTKVTSQRGTVILGYPDDTGTLNSKGRAGSRLAPDGIRRFFYKMTPPLLSKTEEHLLTDIGNLKIEGELKTRHQRAEKKALELLLLGHNLITLGGSHDYGYADGAAFLKSFGEQKPVVINFDAHLDVRPVKNEISSGTPFRRLLEDFSDFDFYEIGIQSQCNSQQHLRWAREKGANILFYDELLLGSKSEEEAQLEFLSDVLVRKRPVFLSVDIDAFSSFAAPGSSQNFPTGLDVKAFLKVLHIITQRADVKILGIYEVAPTVDVGEITQKLSAIIMHRFYQAQLEKLSK